MLVAILALYFISQPTGPRSVDYAQIYNALISASRQVSPCAAGGSCDQLSPLALSLKTYGPWMFVAFAVAFAVKVPMFPVHTWLPDAHVQAPVAGSMILAGGVLKMGTFGFWRSAIPLFATATRQCPPPTCLWVNSWYCWAHSEARFRSGSECSGLWVSSSALRTCCGWCSGCFSDFPLIVSTRPSPT